MKEVSRVLQESFLGASRKLQGCFKKVSRVVQEGCLTGVLSGFEGCLEVFGYLRERFQRCFKNVSRKF